MAKSKKQKRCSVKSYMVYGLVFLGCLTLGYQLAILNAIETIDSVHQVVNVRSSDYDVTSAYEIRNIAALAVQQELAGFRGEDLRDIGKSEILKSVHYVWCGNRTFTFKNYLSVLSVWKILRPDIIEFHQTATPKEDKYDDWFNELKRTIPSFVTREVPQYWDGDFKGCGFWFGIYIGEDVVVTEGIFKHLDMTSSVIYANNSSNGNSKIAVAIGKDHNKKFKEFIRSFQKTEKIPDNAEFCGNMDNRLQLNPTSPCFVIDTAINPKDVFELKSTFGMFARALLYGSDEVKIPRPILPGKIPKIVHYVWFGVTQMDFIMYLSILSALYIVNAEKVYIHGDGGLTGKYLTKIRNDKRVILVMREKPFNVYGHEVVYKQHRSDIVRAEVLLKYGGIYMDWDVLWLRSPDDIINTGYDAVANFDHMQNGNFPETINLGVFMAKPKSTFVKRWQDAFINYRSRDFLYNAVELPYKVYEKYPEHLYIERHLQVMCFRLKCHPTFRDNYKNFMEEQEFDWRTEAYSIHFTFPDPDELNNETSCRNGEGRFAEMGQFILEHEKKIPTKN
ncbi:hypothetical protein MAR_035173 [Mya arenaria]|uniref:Uncharacterized protein n=1 Tax=Mya arenaria TaxID=6604 RepID=A0ABY7EM60_MYAAR|nr:hypothetical protein MAR_035173 [Mya arenaria]